MASNDRSTATVSAEADALRAKREVLRQNLSEKTACVAAMKAASVCLESGRAALSAGEVGDDEVQRLFEAYNSAAAAVGRCDQAFAELKSSAPPELRESHRAAKSAEMEARTKIDTLNRELADFGDQIKKAEAEAQHRAAVQPHFRADENTLRGQKVEIARQANVANRKVESLRNKRAERQAELVKLQESLPQLDAAIVAAETAMINA
jgi:chromosome segregation ATPase